jgi:hypothetical protein
LRCVRFGWGVGRGTPGMECGGVAVSGSAEHRWWRFVERGRRWGAVLGSEGRAKVEGCAFLGGGVVWIGGVWDMLSPRCAWGSAQA